MGILYCSKCGTKLRNGSRFCDRCGWQVDSYFSSQQRAYEAPRCHHCGTLIYDETEKVCPNCGRWLTEEPSGIKALFSCPNCGSLNIHKLVEAEYGDVEAKGREHIPLFGKPSGCLYWIVIGWWYWLYVGWWLEPIRAICSATRKTTYTVKTYTCRRCKYTWDVMK